MTYCIGITLQPTIDTSPPMLQNTACLPQNIDNIAISLNNRVRTVIGIKQKSPVQPPARTHREEPTPSRRSPIRSRMGLSNFIFEIGFYSGKPGIYLSHRGAAAASRAARNFPDDLIEVGEVVGDNR